jgi:leader peptidase (prepilin peptidase)/N-methyltransferase
MSPELLGAFGSPWALGLIGLCVGSFLNVVIHRLPRMMERAWKQESAELLGVAIPDEPALSLSKPASRCPHCGHHIRWFENVPLLSWLVLRGRCSACRAPIGVRYPLVELATALLFAGLAARLGAQPALFAWCGFVAALLALSAIDWDTTLLPDSLTLPLLWSGLIAAAFGWTVPLTTALWGAVAGYLSLWSIYWLFKLTTGKEGMGAGDFKLLAALGAWLGWPMLLPIVLGASLIGAMVGIGMKLSGALREGRYVPFGPFLAGAGLVVLYAGSERVLDWLGWA